MSGQSQKAAWEEGIAMGLLEDMGDPPTPMDAFGVAALCGLSVQPATNGKARLSGSTIYVPTGARDERQHGLVAHELGHWAIQRAGENDTESAAAYVGAAIMLPQRAFSADLRATGWDLRALRARHVNCSAELIARRIATLRDACIAIWDDGRLKTRIVSPWLPPGFARMSKFERELAAQVLESGETVEVGALLWGFPVFSGNWRRVITVCEAEQLAMRY